jgi:hypothetical protein
MHARHFTLTEARALLPKVKELMHAAQMARSEILRLRPEIWPVLRSAALNGGSREAGEVLVQFQKLEAGVKGILALGVVVKDVDAGLVDFLGTRAERDIYLCWRYGEDDIRYWHELDTGFAGRQPIDLYVR